MKRGRAFFAALVSLVLWPLPLWACPVCGAGKDEATRQAFIGSTIFLSLLPLALIGGLILLAARRVRRAEQTAAPTENRSESQSPAAAVHPAE